MKNPLTFFWWGKNEKPVNFFWWGKKSGIFGPKTKRNHYQVDI